MRAYWTRDEPRSERTWLLRNSAVLDFHDACSNSRLHRLARASQGAQSPPSKPPPSKPPRRNPRRRNHRPCPRPSLRQAGVLARFRSDVIRGAQLLSTLVDDGHMRRHCHHEQGAPHHRREHVPEGIGVVAVVRIVVGARRRRRGGRHRDPGGPLHEGVRRADLHARFRQGPAHGVRHAAHEGLELVPVHLVRRGDSA